MMEELMQEILTPLALYIVVTFLTTEVIKRALKALGVVLGKASILVAMVIGTALSYGWALSILPEPVQPGFDYVAVVLTGLIIAGAASGLFSWMETILPQSASMRNGTQ